MLIPDHETAVDFLNYEAIAKTIVALLKENRQRALTIGVHGDWGAGKSSVLKMVESGMSGDDEVACLWFNGWTFQGFDDAKTVLIEVIVTELIRRRTTIGKVKKMGRRLLKRLDLLKLAKHAVGIAFTIKTGLPSSLHLADAVSGLEHVAGNITSMAPEEIEGKLKEATSLLKPADEESVPEEIYHFREEFAKLLEEAKIKQLVVLIDDLDRCLPATAIDTLEAVRLFLFVPKTAFIVGADEGMIEYAVRQHFPNLPLVSGSLPYARSYLEKLIQVPFRIPALGVQESRTYVTLLLVEAIVGEEHEGFSVLLAKARKGMNQPWLGSGIALEDVLALDDAKRDELAAAFVLAQQIGPILAEGTKGNPRQLKRFLNSLAIRLAIARERGFGKDVSAAVLGKLMLAERFQQDFYDHLASETMLAVDGKVRLLAELESVVAESTKGDSKTEVEAKPPKVGRVDGDSERWLSRDWLSRWLKIAPALADVDLRPYVFVARDKRVLATAVEASGLVVLIEHLSGSDLAARSVEPQVRELNLPDADQVFVALRDRVLSAPTLDTQPPGFTGLMLIAKHHQRFQSELLGLVAGLDPGRLGWWITSGWAEVLTAPGMATELEALLTKWASQDENPALETAAKQALARAKKGIH